MNEPVRGLLIAHSTLAAGMVAAVRQISGVEEEVLQPLTNEGRGPEGLIEAVREAVGDAPAILFTDLGSGSCAFAARKISQERPHTAVICGVNLALLLDFVFHRDLPLAQLTERLIDKGRGGITGAHTEKQMHADHSASR